MPLPTRITVPPYTVGRSVRWKARFAVLGARPDYSWTSFRRQLSTPCSLRKCSITSFLPRKQFSNKPATKFFRPFGLGHTVILTNGEDAGSRTVRGWAGRNEAVEKRWRVYAGLGLMFLRILVISFSGNCTCGKRVLSQSVRYVVAGNPWDTSGQTGLHRPPLGEACRSASFFGLGKSEGRGGGWFSRWLNIDDSQLGIRCSSRSPLSPVQEKA
jgi:hypothetical protein